MGEANFYYFTCLKISSNQFINLFYNSKIELF